MVEELKSQNTGVGGLAVIQQDSRYIYYLSTKQSYFDKPTMQTLSSSVQAMREHMRANKVQKLPMPRLGCGLDFLAWDAVQEIILAIFNDENVELLVRYQKDRTDGNFWHDIFVGETVFSTISTILPLVLFVKLS